MTVSTLSFIHDLLKREVESLRLEYHRLCDELLHVDDDSPQFHELKRLRGDAYTLFANANDALSDFESKDW